MNRLSSFGLAIRSWADLTTLRATKRMSAFLTQATLASRRSACFSLPYPRTRNRLVSIQQPIQILSPIFGRRTFVRGHKPSPAVIASPLAPSLWSGRSAARVVEIGSVTKTLGGAGGPALLNCLTKRMRRESLQGADANTTSEPRDEDR